MAHTLSRATVLQHLERNRALLQSAISGRDADWLGQQAITPEWSASDILRHVAVWGELAARCLQDWHGSRDWILTFASEDEFNQEMVAARAHWSLSHVLRAIGEAYDGYEQVLAHASDAELADEAAAPWGETLSRLRLIAGSLSHDQHHLGELAATLANIQPADVEHT